MASDRSDEVSVAAEPRPETNFLLYRFWGFWTRAFLRLFHRIEWMDLDRVPEEGGAILAANHCSFFDIPAVGVDVRRRIHFVARESLLKTPFIAGIVRNSGALLVRSEAPDAAALRKIVSVVRSGELVGIYPEGTRSKDGRMQAFQPGVALAARLADAPIVPVGIAGTFDVMRSGRFFPSLHGKVVVAYGEPFRLARSKGARNLEADVATIRDAVQHEFDRAQALRLACLAGRR